MSGINSDISVKHHINFLALFILQILFGLLVFFPQIGSSAQVSALGARFKLRYSLVLYSFIVCCVATFRGYRLWMDLFYPTDLKECEGVSEYWNGLELESKISDLLYTFMAWSILVQNLVTVKVQMKMFDEFYEHASYYEVGIGQCKNCFEQLYFHTYLLNVVFICIPLSFCVVIFIFEDFNISWRLLVLLGTTSVRCTFVILFLKTSLVLLMASSAFKCFRTIMDIVFPCGGRVIYERDPFACGNLYHNVCTLRGLPFHVRVDRMRILYESLHNMIRRESHLQFVNRLLSIIVLTMGLILSISELARDGPVKMDVDRVLNYLMIGSLWASLIVVLYMGTCFSENSDLSKKLQVLSTTTLKGRDKKQLRIFLHKIAYDPIKPSVGMYFSWNMELLPSIGANVITYVLMAIQMPRNYFIWKGF